MKKKCVYVWSLLVAMLTMTACSSDQNVDQDLSTRTGTFELSLQFDDPGSVTRASNAIPATSWASINQIQFFLYDASGNIAWSAIETPGSGGAATRGYTYATVPANTNYTLVAVANAQSGSDAVETYINGAKKAWSVADVYNWNTNQLLIKPKATVWSGVVTGAALVNAPDLKPYAQPSEVFMGYKTNVAIADGTPATATINLKREVSLMRVRIDQKTNASVVSKVNFVNANAGVLIYNITNEMGIKEGNDGGITNNSTPKNAIYASGGYSATVGSGSAIYLEDPYTSWKDVVVFPNNGGRSNTNTAALAGTGRKYFIVVCGIAEDGHVYAGGATANAGDPVFWYGEIKEVFSPNTIREVNVLLKTGGLPYVPPGPVEYGSLEITVNKPLDWGSIVVTGPIEM